MAAYIEYANSKATRNRKLSNKLVNAMSFLGSMGVTMKVVSGGQAGKGEKGGRVGSTRHDHGNAADADFYMNGRRLVWSKPDDRSVLSSIVTQAARNGVTGIGAGDSYMGDGRIHLGFGSAATWGGGKGVAAPAWLRQAYAKGRALSRTNAGQKLVLASNSPSGYQEPSQPQKPLFQAPSFRPSSDLQGNNKPLFAVPDWQPAAKLEQGFKPPDWSKSSDNVPDLAAQVPLFQAPEWQSGEPTTQTPLFESQSFEPESALISEQTINMQPPEIDEQGWQT